MTSYRQIPESTAEGSFFFRSTFLGREIPFDETKRIYITDVADRRKPHVTGRLNIFQSYVIIMYKHSKCCICIFNFSIIISIG